MTYITDDELDALPDDPMLKFVGIEKLVRDRYEEFLDNLSMNESALTLARRYMSIVLPAAKLYCVPGLQGRIRGWEATAMKALASLLAVTGTAALVVTIVNR